ncbi:hypothetical protein [Terrimonas alba]|uniref:hypothetical protein n=1 Tax=Terrimonas alba TaxID=3349636 RepID=UPI0035F4BC95
MPYFVVTAMDKKNGAKRRRKITLEATGRDSAKIAFMEKCRNVDFEPDLTTLREITRKEYDAIIATLLGKNVKN